MKLFNSLTSKTEEFKPLNDKAISIYTCGPTVYERAHIGNLSSFIYADTLRRALQVTFPNHEIKHVMNITDVDDKTIAASQEEYPNLEPMETLKKLTAEYEKLFMEDLQAVGVDIEKIKFVRATENIDSMQKLIRELVDAGIAYVADDGIYFSIEKYKQAGKKYGQLVEITAQSTGQARVKNDEYDKDNVHDFALWKSQKENEPAWDFKVNGQNLRGRPGWHIECSAMSVGELGQPFDIHTGGVDLKFPHHENEIAQSTANNSEFLAKFFFHSGHLLVGGKKMAKSENNFYTLKDIKDRGFDLLAFRLWVLQSHYRSQAHFSWENLEAAQNRLRVLGNFAELRWQQTAGLMDANQYKDKILSSMEGDLNSPQALSQLSTAEEQKPTDSFITFLDNVFNLSLSKGTDISTGQKELIAQREEARKSQEWQRADEIRKQLAGQGIEINDTEHGPIWSRA